jgi:hypothetical protein
MQIAGFVSAILLLVVIVVVVFTTLSATKVVWLTPAELARSTQPGPLTTFKQKVRNLAGPLWHRFRRTPPQITISSSLLIISSTAAEQIGLGSPATTNANGMRAWILTPTESTELQRQLKTNSGTILLGNSSVMTLNRGQTRVVVGNTGAMVGTPRTATTVDLIPKVVSGAVKVTIAATSIETVVPSGNAQSVKTNFAVACQAVIPNGGSLVLDSGSPKDGNTNRYWLIVSPRVWILTANR